MAHHLKLFIAHPQVLLRFRSAVPSLAIHALSAGATLAVISLDDDLQDALHHAYGTGEWLERGATLTTTDVAFAQQASESGGLAFVETQYSGGGGGQCAMLWRAGAVVAQPDWLDVDTVGKRPRATWPINAALRALGVVGAAGRDEFETFGLGNYRHHDDIVMKALALRV